MISDMADIDMVGIDMADGFRKGLKKENWKTLLQLVKFGLVGVSNTVVSYVLYALIIFLLRGFSWEQDYIFANVVSFTLSIFLKISCPLSGSRNWGAPGILHRYST